MRQHILDFCKKEGWRCRIDEIGNVIVLPANPDAQPEIYFSAHMDHPGFIADGPSTALFYGGVELSYFEGETVRFFDGDQSILATIEKAEQQEGKRSKKIWLKSDAPLKAGLTGVWDVPGMRLRGDRLHARACDDLGGAVTILTLLQRLADQPNADKVGAFFTSAEECGCHGAKWLCQNNSIPKEALLVSIETSSERFDAKVGDGVVIRVGDRLSIFPPQGTAFLCASAMARKVDDEEFCYLRKLMDGGVCESTIFTRFGLNAAAVCVPLGNYHNRRLRDHKIAMEYVSVSDLINMVKLFEASVDNLDKLPQFTTPSIPQYERTAGELGEQFLM